MANVKSLIQRAQKTQHGFTDIKKASEEVFATESPSEAFSIAKELFDSEVAQARMVATFLFGKLSSTSKQSFSFLHKKVSKDPDWRVQEILAQAFDQYCKDIGYEKALPTIKAWLKDSNPNTRRAVTEGLRIWTTRDYFKEHPEVAVQLLSQLRGDDSEYVRKSVGNALRDISRKHKELIQKEVKTWDLSNKETLFTYKLTSKFIK